MNEDERSESSEQRSVNDVTTRETGETYVCSICGTTTEREFRVPSVVRTCEGGCGFVHFLREEILELTEQVPEEVRPPDWNELPADERLRIAIRETDVTLEDLRG